MGFLDKIKEYRRMLSQVERSIYGEKQDYLEIYERNLQLEKEIEARTTELNVANKRMLTLQHIWDMMNSSTPLENVLEKVVNSIHGELGYLHCAIIRKLHDEKGDYMQIATQSKDSAIARVNKIIGIPIEARRLTYNPDGIYADTIKNRKIVQTKDLGGTLKYVMPDLPDDVALAAVTNQPCKSLIIIPLCPMNTEFGWFCVFTSRDELAESETDFLSLFAQQIEMSITITDLFLAVKEQAVTDSLTGLYNRRHFEETLKREVTRAQRQHQPFSIIGIDLDYLKKINDEYGHAYGDLAIKTVAEVLKSNARSIDIPARMGGEEFNVLLPGIDSKGAMVAAERLRVAIEKESVKEVGHVTASIGVATFLEHTDNIDELMEIVDQAMYRAKKNGRNRVVLASVEQKESWTEIAFDTLREILLSPEGELSSRIEPDIKKELEKFFDTNPKELTEKLFQLSDDIIKRYDPMHSEKNSIKEKIHLASKLAKEAKLDEEEIDKIKLSIILYDLGNLFVPEEILLKPGPLNRKEAYQISQHPTIAVKQILKPVEKIQNIFPIVEHHHENWDGSGYPGQLSGEKIPIGSRIIFIVDAYCALISDRPYRRAYSQEEALKILEEGANSKWDGNLVKLFISIIKQ